MQGLRQQLENSWRGRVCFVGLGNPGYGDDAFGVQLATQLMERGLHHVVVAGATPERCLGRVIAGTFDHVVFLDAVEFGADVGSLVVLNAREIATRFPQVSTHKISLEVLAKWIASQSRAQAWMLGVQPQSIKEGIAISEVVQRSVEIVRDLLLDIFTEHEAAETNMELLV